MKTAARKTIKKILYATPVRKVFEERDQAIAQLQQGFSPSAKPRVLPRNEQDVLRRAKENYQFAAALDTSPLPSLGNRWGVFQKAMSDRIRNFATCAEAIDYAQRFANFDHRGPVHARSQYNIDTGKHLLRYEYPSLAHFVDQFEESPFSWPESLTWVDGTRPISEMMYFHISYVLTLLSYDRTITRLCEIGGGYGGPARLWMTNPIHPAQSYTIIDLPESLFFAEIFLSLSLPDIKIRYLSKSGNQASTGEKEIILCPLQLHEDTEKLSFDAVVNTGSLGEMTSDWTKFWEKWLDRQSARLFFSHNLFGNPVEKLFEGRNAFAPMLPEGWDIGYIRTQHPMILLQSVERKFAEIIFKKNPDVNPQDVERSLTAKHAKKLSLEDFIWFAYHINKTSLPAQITFVEKARKDFGYDPVELLHLTENICAHADFSSQTAGEQQAMQTLRASLLERFKAHYPKGTHSE